MTTPDTTPTPMPFQTPTSAPSPIPQDNPTSPAAAPAAGDAAGADLKARQLMAAAADRRMRARLEKTAVRFEELAGELRKLAGKPIDVDYPAAQVASDAQAAILAALEQVHMGLLTTDAYDIDSHAAVVAAMSPANPVGGSAGERR